MKESKGKISRKFIQDMKPDYKYVWQEYGVTPKQVAAAAKRALREIAADRKAGKLVEFTGTLPRENPRPKTAKNWKRIVLTKRQWPVGLVVPRPDTMPKDAEIIRELPEWGNRFCFYLYRDRRKAKYYFRVWSIADGESHSSTDFDCIILNPIEAMRLLVLQEVDQKMADDVRQYQAKKRK